MRIVLVSTLLLVACNSGVKTEQRAAPAAAEPAPSVAATPASMAAAPAAAEPSRGAPLTRVAEASQVCMVNDQFMGREQIPVVVEGKTYFGCCEMCKGRLASDASHRTAKDPVSGKMVDKATAVIGKRESGDVVYFENEANFAAYRAL